MTGEDFQSALEDGGRNEPQWMVLTVAGVVYTGTLLLYADTLVEVDDGKDDYQPCYVSLNHIVAIKRLPK